VTLEHRPPGVDVLTHDHQAQGIETAENRQIGRGEDNVRQVEVLQMGSVRTSILGDLDPHPPTTQGPLSTPSIVKSQFRRNLPGSGVALTISPPLIWLDTSYNTVLCFLESKRRSAPSSSTSCRTKRRRHKSHHHPLRQTTPRWDQLNSTPHRLAVAHGHESHQHVRTRPDASRPP